MTLTVVHRMLPIEGMQSGPARSNQLVKQCASLSLPWYRSSIASASTNLTLKPDPLVLQRAKSVMPIPRKSLF